MPWWITVPAVLAVAVAAGFAVLAVRIALNGQRVAAVFAARRQALDAETLKRKAQAHA
jgi:hypothetical protein